MQNFIANRNILEKCQNDDGSIDYGCYVGLMNQGQNIGAVVLPPNNGMIDGWSMEVPASGSPPVGSTPIPKGQGSIPSQTSYEVPLANPPSGFNGGAEMPFNPGGGSFGGGGASGGGTGGAW